MKAALLFWHEARLQGRYLLAMKLYAVGNSERYPDGIKYRLILLDLWTKDRVLMDNHPPKGPHFHINHEEYAYTFRNEETLFADFRRLAFECLEVRL
jgi:hypothetical protein